MIVYIDLKGWNSHVHRGFPRNYESTNLGRDNLRAARAEVHTALILGGTTCLTRLV